MKDVKKMIRDLDEVERQEGRLRKYLDGLRYEKPSVRKRRKASLAGWRRKVSARNPEIRAFDGSIWKNGRLLTPRKGRS